MYDDYCYLFTILKLHNLHLEIKMIISVCILGILLRYILLFLLCLTFVAYWRKNVFYIGRSIIFFLLFNNMMNISNLIQMVIMLIKSKTKY